MRHAAFRCWTPRHASAWPLMHIHDVRSVVGVRVDTHTDQFPKLLRVVLPWERWVVTLLYLLAEGQEIHLVSIEGALESCHLIQQTA